MGGNPLTRLRWKIAHECPLDWPAWTALILVVIASWFSYESWQLEKEDRRLLSTSGIVPAVTFRNPDHSKAGNSVQDYYNVLPGEMDRFVLVKHLLLSAREKGLFPQRADYELEGESMTKVVRYRLSMPLRGNFPEIQAFLADVLNKNRSIAIDSINVKRESIESSAVEVRAQFSILMVRR
ncbi:MAG: hypothetical protein LBD67_00670 [Candidatus Accumulibacter sp.]|jgi:hypothetical protein|nr:hypothetical protein [Accumulibacter sp.]